MRLVIAAAAAVALLATGGAFAQHSHHATKSKGDRNASTRAFEAVNAKMHKDMVIRFSGNADADFIKAMIPHHQGAIDMANVVLQHGTDPEVKKLAEEIIKAQQSEIAWMKEWLKKQGQ